jgi:transmembrane sensor
MPSSSEPGAPDRALAKRLRQLLHNDEVPLASVQASDFDPDSPAEKQFVQTLLDYRTATVTARPAPTVEQSETMWAGIEAFMEATAKAPGDRSVQKESAREEAVQNERAPRRDRAPRRSRSTLPARVQWSALAFLIVAAVGVIWFVLQPDPLQENLVARSTDRVQTLTTADGSVVRLRPNSSLYRVDTDAATRYRLEGEARFSVTSRPEGSSDAPFEVDAGDARVRVLGTEFTVRAWTDAPSVYLSEGSVAVSHTPSARVDTLRPGQQGTVRKSGDIELVRADSTMFVAWLQNRMILDQRPASSVAKELEQHFDIQIRLPEHVQQETVSGELTLTSRSDALRDLGIVLGGTFEEIEPDVYRLTLDA